MHRITTAILAILAIGAVAGGSAAAAYAPVTFTPPGIVLTSDDGTCGSVTVTAHGFGIASGTVYQIVAGSGYPAATRTITAVGNTAVATFTLAEAGEWGTSAIRTSAGGYLAATSSMGPNGTSWYHIRSC